MIVRSFLLSLFFFSPLSGEVKLSPEQPSPEKMASELGVKLPPRPWHLADVWWKFEKPVENFESLDVEVSIDRDVPDTYNLYVAPVGLARINGLDFYGGIQTNVNGWVSGKKRTRVHPGMGGIFSRWSRDKRTPIGLDHVRKVDGGLCESAGYEGSFCSVRRPFKWGKGTYVFSIKKGAAKGESTWFDCTVSSKDTEKTFDVGGLLFEGANFSFWGNHSAFVEVYATTKIPRSGIPKVKVTFGYPILNGKKPKLASARAYHPSSGTAGSPACARVRGVGDKVEVEVGPIFQRDPAKTGYSLKLSP